jgi:hypothetical protein
MRVSEWEEKMLALPVAASVTEESREHSESDMDFVPRERDIELESLHKKYGGGGDYWLHLARCACERCVIIRIKKRRAS